MQDPSGYEAALDPWLEALFPTVTQVGFEGAGAAAHSSALASKFIVEVRTGAAAAADGHSATNGIAATPETRPSNGGDKAVEEWEREQLFRDACTAAAHFSELAATASGMTAPAAAASQQRDVANAQRDASASNGHASNSDGTAGANEATHTEGTSQRQPRPARSWEPYWATVAETRRLTAVDHWQVVQHLELDTSAPQATCICYAPGDLVTMWPWVAPARALEFLKRMGLAEGAPPASSGDSIYSVSRNTSRNTLLLARA